MGIKAPKPTPDIERLISLMRMGNMQIATKDKEEILLYGMLYSLHNNQYSG